MEYRVEQKYMVSDAEMIFLQKQLETCMHYDKYHPIYELFILQNPLLLKNFQLEENHNYQISIDKGFLQIYYETKEVIINE